MSGDEPAPTPRRGGRRPPSGRPLELARIRRRIDELDPRIVALLNERAVLGREAGRAKALAGRRAIRDPEREREVLLRVAMANGGPMQPGRPPVDLPAGRRRDAHASRPSDRRAMTVDPAGD